MIFHNRQFLKKLALGSLLASGLGLFSSCYNGETKSDTKIQFMPDMADSPTVKAQEDYLDPPEGSVALSAIYYPKDVVEAEKVLKNPFPQTDEIVAQGKKLWDTFCIPCHGPQGKGDSSLGPAFPPPPDITGEAYRDRGDGLFFYRITFGGALMPAYGYATDYAERWKIVNYIRSLQGATSHESK